MKRLLIIFSAITIITSVMGLTPASSYEKSIDESIKAMIAMQACSDSSQMDCIESVKVTHVDGTSKEVNLSFGDLKNLPNLGATRYESQVINLKYEYEKKGGPLKTTGVYVNLKTQWIDIPTGGFQLPGFNVMFLNASELFDTDTFTFVVRTSWLKPQNVALYGKNAIFKEEKIKGGNRFTLGGSKLTQAVFDDSNKYSLLYKPEGEMLKADRIQDTISLIVDHAANFSQSAYPTKCADQGYPVASSNASSAGQPKLKSPNEIEYSIAAPHFKPDGTVFQGYFQAELNTKYLECIWPGNEISKSTEFSISVIDDQGIKQVATTAVTFKNNIISLKASGFHYSAPTIKLEGNFGKPTSLESSVPTPSKSPLTETTSTSSQNTQPSPDPVSSPIAVTTKKSTIICAKGKTSKKITAERPKCPAGYKRK